MEKSIITPPSYSDDSKIQALRDSVLGPQVEKSIDGEVGVRVTAKDDDFVSKKAPADLSKFKGPHFVNEFVKEGVKKKLPYCLIYITEVDGIPIVNFVTTMGGGDPTADMMKHIVEQNRSHFGKDQKRIEDEDLNEPLGEKQPCTDDVCDTCQ